MLPSVFSIDSEYRKSNNNMIIGLNKMENKSQNLGNNLYINNGKNESIEKELFSNEALEKKASLNYVNPLSNRVKYFFFL